MCQRTRRCFSGSPAASCPTGAVTRYAGRLGERCGGQPRAGSAATQRHRIVDACAKSHVFRVERSRRPPIDVTVRVVFGTSRAPSHGRTLAPPSRRDRHARRDHFHRSDHLDHGRWPPTWSYPVPRCVGRVSTLPAAALPAAFSFVGTGPRMFPGFGKRTAVCCVALRPLERDASSRERKRRVLPRQELLFSLRCLAATARIVHRITWDGTQPSSWVPPPSFSDVR